MNNLQVLPPVEPDHTEIPIPEQAPEPTPNGLPPMTAQLKYFNWAMNKFKL